MAGQDKLSERIAALEAKIAVLEAALNVATLSFPTGMSDYEVPPSRSTEPWSQREPCPPRAPAT